MDRPAKRARLLSDDDNSDSDNATLQHADPSKLSNGFNVNAEYARRFEHNKKREEKDRLEEKYGKTIPALNAKEEEQGDGSDDSSSDESEDDDAELATKDVDEEIMDTLNAIRKKDPRVYNKDVKFYREFALDSEGAAKVKKEKPMYLPDYHRQNLLAGHVGAESEDEDEGRDVPRTYDQEQDRIRREFVVATHPDADDSDNLVITKPKPKHADLPQVGKPLQITETDVKQADKDPETYLSNFMASRAWLPTSTSRSQAFESDDSDDERRAEAFEDAYNMRFEDPATANEKLQSFARDVGKYSVRRDEKKSARQRTRERETEKKEAAKREREEEKSRLRKLKIEEAEEKIRKIKEAAGLRKGEAIDFEEWKDVIEGDFDDDRWEVEMRRRFGEEYYASNEDPGESEEGSEGEERSGKKKRRLHKPRWDDDLDITDLVPEFEDEEEQKKPNFTLSDDDDDEDGGINLDATSDVNEEDTMAINEPSATHKKPKTKKDRAKEKAEAKRNARRERRQIESLVDSNLPLAATTATASSTARAPVGFRYRETSPQTFGLSARDILFADDAQLNQFAGLKKLTAWREEEKKRKDRKRFSKKGRVREWRKETFGDREGPRIEREKVEGEGGKKRKRAKKGTKAGGGAMVEG